MKTFDNLMYRIYSIVTHGL